MGLISRIKTWVDKEVLTHTDLNAEFDNITDNIPASTTSVVGMVQLEDSHASTSVTKAATPNSVKEAYDHAGGAHKNTHDPEDGADALDTASPSELASVQAAGVGSSHSLARADHQHRIQHSIADNHLVTIDHASVADNDYAKFTAGGLEGRSKAEVLSDLNVEDGADVTDATNVNAAGAVMEADFNAKGNILSASANDTPLILAVGSNTQVLSANAGTGTGLEWVNPDTPGAHKNSHDPVDGADALDTTVPDEIAGVQGVAQGSSHEFVRADHQHRIQHSIADNHLVTMDDTDAADNDYAKLTANGLEGRSYSEVMGDLSGQAAASFDMNSQALTKLSNVVTTHTPGAAGTATLDLDVSRIHDITMPAGNITIAVSNENNGDIFTVRPLQDATGSRTITWFSTIKWAGGSAPTLTTTGAKADTFIFRVTGTDTYDGFVVGQNI